MTQETKLCTGPCGKTKPIDAFDVVAGRRKRWCSECLTLFGREAYIESLPPSKRSKYKGQVGYKYHKPADPIHPKTASDQPIGMAAPLFVTTGLLRFGVSSIALIDTRQPGHVEVRLNIHEVNGKGFPEALAFHFDGSEAQTLLSSLDGVTGQPSAEIVSLRAALREMENERDTLQKRVEELESKQQQLRTALGL